MTPPPGSTPFTPLSHPFHTPFTVVSRVFHSGMGEGIPVRGRGRGRIGDSPCFTPVSHLFHIADGFPVPSFHGMAVRVVAPVKRRETGCFSVVRKGVLMPVRIFHGGSNYFPNVSRAKRLPNAQNSMSFHGVSRGIWKISPLFHSVSPLFHISMAFQCGVSQCFTGVSQRPFEFFTHPPSL